MFTRMTREEFLKRAAARAKLADLDLLKKSFRTPLDENGVCYEFGAASGEVSVFGGGVIETTAIAYAVKVIQREGEDEAYETCPHHPIAVVARANLKRLRRDLMMRQAPVPVAA